jgi:RNA polymerase sigma factor (sigma-70 family)
MPKFRLDSIAELARQLEFSPQETRAAQVQSAEHLLHLIDPARAYPLEFVIFKITGYHPRQGAAGGDLLTGLALQHDLGLLIEQVSNTLNVHTEASAEPVLAICDVAERFNVTSKTIQRWRRRGLPARRFLFGDGKRRVGFLLSSVDRFFRTHREEVDETTANFSVVGEDERAEMVRRARRLALEGQCSVEEITRRVGRWMKRSPLTVLHTVRRHDEQNAADAIFAHAAAAIAAEEREQALKHFRRGTAIGELARRMSRPRAMVYRALLEERVARLKRKKVRFIDDPLYHGEDANEAVEAIAGQQSGEQIVVAATPSREREDRGGVAGDLPVYLQELCRTPLLTPSRERALFLKLNYHKFQFVTARRRLDPQFARHRDLQRLEGHLRRATETKNAIVRANLRLVVSVARKHLRAGLSLMELISDGNVTLMRAVDGFDAHRGHRFSTYATLALMKGFARGVPALLEARGRTASAAADPAALAALPDARGGRVAERMMARDEVRRLIALLDERERRVLLAHYGIAADDAAISRGGDRSSVGDSYEELGHRMGLSRQRVRQIEQTALAKLRAAVHENPAERARD